MAVTTGVCLKRLLPRLLPRLPPRLVSRAGVGPVSVSGLSTSARRSQVQLTSERYPHLQRGSFATLTDEDISIFQSILDPGTSGQLIFRIPV